MLTKGRGHRSRGAGGFTGALAAVAEARKNSNASSSNMAPSNSEDISTDESDSESSYPESNDSEDETSNGSSLKSGSSSAVPPATSRVPLRGKLITPKNNASSTMTVVITGTKI